MNFYLLTEIDEGRKSSPQFSHIYDPGGTDAALSSILMNVSAQ
jgi:hypothetical protein